MRTTRCMHKRSPRETIPRSPRTNDRIIKEANRYVRANTIAPERFGFRCSTGCAATFRNGWCAKVARAGLRPVRHAVVSVLMRRLAERPSNIAFITGMS